MEKANLEIRAAAKRNGVPVWYIAEVLGVSEPTMTRRLRRELSGVEKDSIITIIENLKGEREKGNYCEP